MVLRRWLTGVLMVLLPVWAAAQEEVEGLEAWVEETGDAWAAGEMNDQWLQLLARPVNLNDSAAVADLPLLTPFQRQALHNYIVLHGQLLSHGELMFVPGFDSVLVARLRPVTVTAPYEAPRRWRLADGRQRLHLGLGGSADSTGDGLRALLVYSYSLHDRVELRLVADKDPGEGWGRGNFVGYHLMLRDMGRVERLIAGRYNLQFGQGLTLWTGLRPFNLTGAVPLRFGSGVRPAVTFYEEGYQEGLAARVRLTRCLRLSAFGSKVDGVSLAGGRLEWRRDGLVVGATAAYTLVDSVVTPQQRLYSQHYFAGDRLLNGGVDAVWQWRFLTLFGEGALDGHGHGAMVGGLALRPDSRLRLGLTARRYHRDYHNLHAQGYTLGNTQGEQGVSLDVESRLPLGFTGLASLDVYRFDALRYATYSPSAGEWLRLQVGRQWDGWLEATVRYAYRRKERNIPNLDSTLYLGEQTVRQQWTGEVRVTTGSWTLTGRGVWAIYDSEAATRQGGGLVSLAARYAWRRLQAQAALAWFDVDGYYARIYYNECNLQYAWSMPALYGRGWRGYAVVRYAVNDRWLLAGKYALTWDGVCRRTWMLQLRCRF